jgi:mRNA degradation ribonuclease J1/J2
MRDVKSILLGHAHYDHAMDLPYIMEKLAPTPSSTAARR